MMMASAETSPEWQSIRKRVSDLSREKVDPAKSIGNRLKEIEAFIHQAKAQFRKAQLQGEKIDGLKTEMDGLMGQQSIRLDSIDVDLQNIADKFGSVDKKYKAFEAELAKKEGIERALKTIGRLTLLEEQIKKKLERSDMEELKGLIWEDVSGLLKEATKDSVQRPEFESKMLAKADVVKLGMKADQDLVDAVIERIEQRVEKMYGDVELIKMNEEAEELHRQQQRKKEKEIVDLMSVLDNRVKLTSENVEEDLTQVQKALAGKADRTKSYKFFNNSTPWIEHQRLTVLNDVLEIKQTKWTLTGYLLSQSGCGKCKTLDDSMKDSQTWTGLLSNVWHAIVLGKLSESTLAGDADGHSES